MEQRSIADKQLNVWIPEDLKSYLAERAEQEKRGMNLIVAELIRQDKARRNGQVVEQHSLPAIQEIVRAELRQAHAQLRHDLREDIKLDIVDVLQDFLRKGFDRLAALCVHAIRNTGIGRRLTYTLLAKAYNPTFAREVYEDAREKVHRELFPGKPASRHLAIRRSKRRCSTIMNMTRSRTYHRSTV